MNCMDQRVSFSPQPSTEKENDECSEGSDKYKISDPPSPTPPENPSSKPYSRRMDNEKGFVTVNFPIPELCVGLVIGKGGAEVHAINEKTGCRLQVSTEPSPIGYRNVEIHGLPENIDAARECISQVLNRIHHSPPAPHSGAQRQEGETVKTVTVEIPIPAHKCGAVIGRGGDTMQKLRSWSNCQIQLIQENSMPTTTKPLRITGDQQSVEYAQRLVAEVLAKNEGPPPPKHEAPSAPPQETYYENKSLHVKVPRSSVGAIMGPQGMNIKRLSDQTCTSIHVLPEEDPKVMERLITIVGSPDKVYLAADVIRTIITSCNSPDYYVHNVYYMDVPAAKCGLVIGKGGDVIKQINADSGARCELARETKMDAHFKTFVLRGTDLQIEHAKHLIYTKVGDIPPNTPFVPKHRPNANPMQIPSLMNPVHPTQQQQLQAHMQARHQMQARSPQQQNTLTNVQMWAGAPIIQNQHPQHPQTQILQNQLHHQQQQQIQQQQFQQHQQIQYQQQQLQQQRQFQQQKFQQIQQQQMAMFPQQNQNFPVMHPPMQGQQNPNWFRMMQQQQQNQQGQPIYPNQGPPYQQAPLQQMQNQMRNSPRQQNNSYQPQPSPQKPQASPQHLPKARNTPKPAATASTTPKEGGSSKSPAKAKEPAKATNGSGSTENKEDGAKKEAKENNSESEEGEGERDYSEQWYQYYLSMNEPEAAENVRKRIEEMKLEKAEKAQASVSRR
ncbi:hypothetical protein L3Y34_010692 [Caenorhabditis briggsae]|uniref:K Homology domain-containing protein n=1 Tax=Caenorhabditis briggsae TaxID=6238 RepID=A0AAE8ZSA9_CAEBR|nr:hypothetical protein L3Y34_010692 [Caenorhabditis briggsae]